MRTFRLIRCSIAAVLGLLSSQVGCDQPTNPHAPPLDIRGQYDVVWLIGFNWPDDPGIRSDPALPYGECSGSVIIDRQDRDSFHGEITTHAGAEPPCHSASVELTGRLV